MGQLASNSGNIRFGGKAFQTGSTQLRKKLA